MDNPKRLTREQMVLVADRLRSENKTIVVTNGCFDILHVGHVTYLAEAALQGDILIVGLNSDRSVQGIKGPLRPVIQEDHRARVLSALACVDYVVLFHEPDPGALIRAVKPHVLVKGADWEEKDIIGADVVKANGGRVARIAMEPGISTSLIIERILRIHG
ncbi:MAG: D-glycero-beta-D-manno-heptose 1-phosphate adenylyltransferase [Pseudomonadota bacterium]